MSLSLGACRSRPGIRVHGTGGDEDVVTIDGLPVTTPDQDPARPGTHRRRPSASRPCRQAESLRLHVDPPPGARGAARLRAAHARRPNPRSPAASWRTASSRSSPAGRPAARPWSTPSSRATKVDFHWPAARLVVETDGADSNTVGAAGAFVEYVLLSAPSVSTMSRAAGQWKSTGGPRRGRRPGPRGEAGFGDEREEAVLQLAAGDRGFGRRHRGAEAGGAASAGRRVDVEAQAFGLAAEGA